MLNINPVKTRAPSHQLTRTTDDGVKETDRLEHPRKRLCSSHIELELILPFMSPFYPHQSSEPKAEIN